MLLAFGALAAGIIILIFSADKFVEGAAVVAKRLGLPSILIGMLVIGFGSSAPEMVISALSSYQGNPNLALGNAFGSNITNIALILGVTALISPISVQSSVLQRELPLLAFATATAAGLLYLDGNLSRVDGLLLIGLFLIIMGWSIRAGMQSNQDNLAEVVEQEFSEPMSMSKALVFLITGLIFLVLSSRLLVWGGVEIAQALGVSDLIIGVKIIQMLNPKVGFLDWCGGLVWLRVDEGFDVREKMQKVAGHAMCLLGKFEQFHPVSTAEKTLSNSIRKKFDPKMLLNRELLN